MTISNLKQIKEIARTHSITQAANNLGIAQPHLSKTVKELEITLGFAIFNRSVKGVFPTDKGAVFLSYVDKILEQLENIDRLSQTEIDHRPFSVSIPRGSYIAEGFIKFVTENGHKDNSSFDISETNSVETINTIAEKRFNIGVIRYQNGQEKYFLDYLAEKGLKSDLVWEFEMLVMMSSKNPLAIKAEITSDDLGQFVEITYGDNKIPYRGAPASASFSVNSGSAAKKRCIYIYDRGGQFSLLRSLPETYMWVAPAPDSVLNAFDLIQRKCPHSRNRYRDLLVFRKGYRFSAMDKNFIDCLYKLRNEVSLKNYR
ncbi:MAG: LysR family transcriptional regulator [Spirochaetaceae bacterium]|jgi:DNA-binding transcriptional LysR family regulator|nr:LysR family transcriptional regulator [Spirochaetaceae bacterium]